VQLKVQKLSVPLSSPWPIDLTLLNLSAGSGLTMATSGVGFGVLGVNLVVGGAELTQTLLNIFFRRH
jgi:hypothetical protein